MKAIILSLYSVTFQYFALCGAVDIYVHSGEGVDNSSCWTGGLDMPCKDLALGLEGLQHYNNSALWLASGEYYLVGNGTTTFNFLRMTTIAIKSLTDTEGLELDVLPVTILCDEGSGFSFINATNISISGIKFVGCGVVQITTSKIDGYDFKNALFAIYFLYCYSVTLNRVEILHTPGIGVGMYGTVGIIKITNCRFMSNSVQEENHGGGGLYIEFPYCVPSALENQSSNSSECTTISNVPFWFVSYSEYYISDCVFYNNTARVANIEQHTFILPHKQNHLAFGRGGGLSVIFKGNSSNNTIQVTNCNFTQNIALWGGGLFVEHQDNSSHNWFTIESSDFNGNEVFYTRSRTKGTGGGGARVGYIFFGTSETSHNQLKFNNIMFMQNKAYFGGGLSFYTAKERLQATNKLVFENCTWVSNVARVGSAVDLALWHASLWEAAVQPTFTNCAFFMNNANYADELESYAVGLGALYSDSLPVSLDGYTEFKSNKNTALACVGGVVSFKVGSETIFWNNSGRNGGAIALMGVAYIEVSMQSTLRFLNNSAEVKGGAIFGASIGEHDLISSRNCFIRYNDLEITTPTLWKSKLVFIGNTANSKTNSIHATSLLSCMWGGAFGSAEEEADNVFCWNMNETHPEQWIYSSDCSNEISTSPTAFFPANDSSNPELFVSVFPGISKVLPLYTQDDRMHKVTNLTVMTAKLTNEELQNDSYIDSTSLYISDNSIKLHGLPGSNVTIRLETIEPGVIAYHFNAKLSECPLGMVYTTSECRCNGTSMYGSLVRCDYNNSKLLRGAWFGKPHPNSDQYVAGLCPYIAPLTTQQEPLYKLSQSYEDVCAKINRAGALCGHCKPQYGPIVNRGENSECHFCPPSVAKRNWIFFLLTEYLPVFVFFIMVVFFNISVTSGPANGFVFFAQILTTVFKLDGDGVIQLESITTRAETLKTLYVIPYDIWNQRFFQPLVPKYCISPNITSLQLIIIGYVAAVFPLMLVMIFSFFVWIYGIGFKPVVWLFRPLHHFFSRFRRIWNLQDSITHALATFILVSYSRITFVSLLPFTNVPLFTSNSTLKNVLYYDGTIEYLGISHVPYLVTTILALLTFVAIPPLLLIGPSVILLIKKNMKKVSPRYELPSFLIPGPLLSQFLNVFHGCYKNGTGGENGNVDFRWFAGYYFILRVVLYIVYAFTPNWFFQYVVQQLVCLFALLSFVILQPYKRNFLNFVDGTMFALLVAITNLSMYNYYLTKLEERLSYWAFSLQYILIFVPLVYISIYSFFFLWKKLHRYELCFFKRNRPLIETVEQANDDDILDYADNQEKYRGVNSRGASLATSSSNISERNSLIPDTGSENKSSKKHTTNSYGSTA